MQTKPIVIGIGEFLWDVLPTGRKAGGAPVNFAYHASQHGTEGWGISAVGDDEDGRELLARKAGAICFGTLAQRNGASRQTTLALLDAAPADAYRIYDINLRQHYYSKELIEQSLDMANILKINDEELLTLQEMFALPVGTDEACRLLQKRYELKMVVLTGGSRFSSVYYGDGKLSTLPTPKVDVVDTVGAGDSFTGCLIASLLTGSSVEEAHRRAVDTAAYVCTTAGAWPPPQA